MISDLKKVYSRRTKKEKILTVGVLVCMVLVMLLVAARCTEMPIAANAVSEWVSDTLLWFVAGKVPIFALAVFIVAALPLMVVSSAVIDEISQKRTAFALPFYFYLLLFFTETLFYQPMAFTVITWLALLILSLLLFALAKGRRGKLFYLMAAAFVLLLVLEPGKTALAVIQYLICLAVNTAMAFVMNRASVLKKKYWYAVMLVLYLVLFFIGRLC